MNINKKIIFYVFLLILAPGICLGSQDKAYKDFNLIIIAINNVGCEHMSLYGYPRKTTPNLDAWAQKALVFEDVYTPASWTLPVMTTVFTSLNPYTHKIMDRYLENRLSPNIKVLPQILKDNDYTTAAFTGGLDDSKFFGHMQGFSTVDNNPPFTRFPVTIKQSQEWLAKNSKKKFFLFIHGYDAHPPFNPSQQFKGIFSNPKDKKITIDPKFAYRGFRNSDGQYYANCLHPSPLFATKKEEPSGKQIDRNLLINKWVLSPPVKLTQDDIDYLRDLYDEAVLSLDSRVAKFLDSLSEDILKNTIIIIFSEHGEMFAKHGRFGRAGTLRGTLYDEVVHVPLIIKLPGVEGHRIKGLVGLIDLMPTILDMLDIPAPEKLQGKSILPLIKQGQQVNDFVYGGATYNFAYLPMKKMYQYPSINESIRDYDWKLIHEVVFKNSDAKNEPAPLVKEEIFELYDLRSDPDEKTNLIHKYPEKTKELRDKLNRWADDCRKFEPSTASTHKIPESLVEEARKNGYW